jgi:TolB-like protein
MIKYKTVYKTDKAVMCQKKYFNQFLGLFLLIFVLVGFGCQKSVPVTNGGLPQNGRPVPFDLVRSSYAAGDALAEHLKKSCMDEDDPIASASFVNIDALYQSSTFGRVISQQITSRLFQNGYNCIELRMRERTIFIEEEQGEFALSRQIKNIGIKHNIKAFLAGTYSVTPRYVYVSARIVNTENNSILASHDYAIRLNAHIYSMLNL